MITKKVVKYIQSLSYKKFRDDENVFLAEGPKLIAELILSKKVPAKIICAEKKWILQNQHLLQHVQPENIYETDTSYLEKISQLKTPHEVLGVFKKPTPIDQYDFKNKVTLVLDDLQDPGNVGTIIRIADWYGIQNIVCSKNTADNFNPKVVQSTMGSLLRVNVQYTDLIEWMQEQKEIPFYAAVLEGKSIYESGRIREGILVIGNESKGIQPDILRLIRNKITIPRIGNAESLNAAVATGIILSEWIGDGN